MTTSSSAIRSSTSNSPSSALICVRRGSAYFFLISWSSSLITPRSFAGLFSRESRYLIRATSSFFSSSSSVRARRVSRRSGMSRMWFAWISESLNRFISLVRASSESCEARMILMTSSR